jgi:colanic acid biosynthesis glycosyl transferase WcaI
LEKVKILFLTQWFQPESLFKGLPFAKALKDKGHDVEVLTGFPNYPEGKVYPGYRIRLVKHEIMDGVTVHRVALYPSHDQSALHRIMSYLSFALSAFFLGPWLIKKPDVIYVYNLVTLGPSAFLLRSLFGSKVIIDVQDIWPESVINSQMLQNNLLLKIISWVCRWVYSSVDRIAVLSPGFKSELIRRGILPAKIEVIYNWCNEASIRKDLAPPDSGKDFDTSDKFVVLFAGTMGLAQGLDTLLKCAEICRTKLPDVQFVLIGGGVDRQRLQQMTVEMKLDNVTFLPPRTIEAMGEIYAMADVLLVHLKDYPIFRITVPSKTQAYLYMGKPIIMAVHGDAAALVEQAGAGILCEPDNPHAMSDAVMALRDTGVSERRKMGEAGYRYYMQNLSFEKGVKNFEQVMFSLVGTKGKIEPDMNTL